MTANEMADALELRADRISSRGTEGYEDSEYSEILTTASEYYVLTVLEKLSPTRKGLEESELRAWGLANFIGSGSATPLPLEGTEITNGRYYTLKSDVWFIIHETADISALDCDDRQIEASVDPITHSQIKAFKRNFYKKPKVILNEDARVYRLASARVDDGETDLSARTVKRVEIIEDPREFTVTDYKYRYFKYIPEIVVDRSIISNQRNCIVDDMQHRVILDIAEAVMKGVTDRKQIANLIPFNMVR